MKRLSLRLGVALVSLVAAVGLAEVLVRALDPYGVSYYRDLERWKGEAVSFPFPHPPPPESRIFQHEAGLDVRFETFRLCTDEVGLRSASPGEPTRTPAPREALVVLCLGDSTTLGWGVDHADTWPALLEADGLAPDGRPLVVHNAGHNIYDTAQEADLLSALGPLLSPQVVLVQLNANDLSPTIDVYNETLALALVAPTGLGKLWEQVKFGVGKQLIGLRGLLRYRSRLAEVRRAGGAGSVPLEVLYPYPDGWPRVAAALGRIREQCEDLGAVLVLLDNGDPRVPDVAPWCDTEDVLYLDTAWTEADRARDVRNSAADAHANALGNRLVVDKVLRGLRAFGLLAAAGEDAEWLREVAAEEAARSVGTTARGLYLRYCATCHGEQGRGDGSNKDLDRPPRDFTLGGFAFGDTPEALFKTVSEGLGGSNPMPAFAGELSEEEIRAVVSHVATLLPEREPPPAGAAEVVAGAEAVIARGYLPPLAEGGEGHRRGIAVGLPGGLGLLFGDRPPLRLGAELVGVIAGGLVRRAEWEGRGGTPLELVGSAVPLSGEIRAGTGGDALSLTPALASVSRLGREVTLELDLLHAPTGSRPGALVETLRGLTTSLGPGVARRLTLRDGADGTAWRYAVQVLWLTEPAGESLLAERGGGSGVALRVPGKGWVVAVPLDLDGATAAAGPRGLALDRELADGGTWDMEVAILMLAELDQAALETLVLEVGP